MTQCQATAPDLDGFRPWHTCVRESGHDGRHYAESWIGWTSDRMGLSYATGFVENAVAPEDRQVTADG